MSKQLIVDRHTTPGTPVLDPVATVKVPVYDTMADVTADLANLADGQIVATADTGSELSAPTDTVQSGNMHAVTSNAVAEALSWSESFQEKKTSETWVNGKPIYRMGFQVSNINIKINEEVLLSSFLSGISIDALIKLQGTVKFPNISGGVTATIPNAYINLSYHTSDGGVYINNEYSSDSNGVTVVLYVEYTKTTD